MALETLKSISSVNKVALYHADVDTEAKEDAASEAFIFVDHQTNQITFKIQAGPVRENGLNGCQVADMIEVARVIIAELNQRFPCRENALTLTKLDEALMWQRERTRERTVRGVEGLNRT
jgi:hypothetical protein